jgi:hypothetical protein
LHFVVKIILEMFVRNLELLLSPPAENSQLKKTMLNLGSLHLKNPPPGGSSN